MSNLPVKLSEKVGEEKLAICMQHSCQTFHQHLYPTHSQEVDELVRAADTDNDGLITFDEFRRMMGR